MKNGGHNIPADVIERRYYKGIKNLFELFMPICDFWFITDNTFGQLIQIARKEEIENVIKDTELWNVINTQFYESKTRKY